MPLSLTVSMTPRGHGEVQSLMAVPLQSTSLGHPPALPRALEMPVVQDTKGRAAPASGVLNSLTFPARCKVYVRHVVGWEEDRREALDLEISNQ